MANNNYISFKGTIIFFDDRKSTALLPPPGGAVWKRPPSPAWANVPEIKGEYGCSAPEECSCRYCK